MQTPFFTIITPTYNRASMLQFSINSVLAQTFSDFELLIIDDGSTDHTKEVVLSVNDPRIRYIYQPNRERSAARNNGIINACGKYICFIDSDDEYLPMFLERLHDFIQSKNFEKALYYTGTFSDNGIEKIKNPVYDNPGIHPAVWIWSKLLSNCGVCVHRDLLKEHLFPEQFNVWEDTHLWLRLAVTFPFYQLPEYLAVVKQHDKQSIFNMFGDIDVKHIDRYASSIRHLLGHYYPLVGKYISAEMKRNFLHQKYWLFATIAVEKNMFGRSLQMFKRTLMNYPAFIFKPRFLKVILLMMHNYLTCFYQSSLFYRTKVKSAKVESGVKI